MATILIDFYILLITKYEKKKKKIFRAGAFKFIFLQMH